MFSEILPLPAPPSDGNLGPIPDAQVSGEIEMRQENGEQPAPAPRPPPPPAPVATHTRNIGIIHPPPDIRAIIDKTASFVAKNGPEFEKRILANSAGNNKFNFLMPSDPYHAYYEHKVTEQRAQQQLASEEPSGDSEQPPDSGAGPGPGDGAGPQTAAPVPSGESAAKVDPAAQFRVVPKKVLEPPEAEQYTVRLPEGITGEELDIIKLTAQFVARNGKYFLTSLTTREGNNPQFHFLKPTHSMFTFFTTLADAYSKVLMPPTGMTEKLRTPTGMTEKLRRSVIDMTTVLERCLHRLEWERSQEQARQKAEDEIEQERMQMAMIDWHDFVVVETIEFADDEDEELPIPMTLEEVIRRSKMSALGEEEASGAAEPSKEMEMEMDEEEIQLVAEGMRAARIDENGHEVRKTDEKTPGDEPEPPLRIVKNWKRPEERIPSERDPTKFVISPITGELIPISEMAEHMRISLIDPKYKEQKERMMAKIRETTLAADDEISRNIVGLARTRPDIFGTTEEEVSNAVKAEIEKKKDEPPKQVIWDGHSGSIGRTATQALSQNLSSEDQSGDNNDSRNLPGAAPPPRPGVPTVRPLPPPPNMLPMVPRYPGNTVQYSIPAAGGGILAPPPRPGLIQVSPSVRPPPPPMSITPQQQGMTRPLLPPPPTIPVPPPPGSQFTPLGIPRPYVPMSIPPPNMLMVPPPPLPHVMPPPPPPEEAPPPLPDEPEPKRQKADEISLIPEDQFLAQHPGSARISVSVPNMDEGNLKGQLLEIMVQSLSETVGSLKEKIAGELQLPANKQKLSGRAGFLKDNLTLAYYNITAGEALTLALRERGGRKR